MRFPDHGDGEFTVQSTGHKISLYCSLNLEIKRPRGVFDYDMMDYYYPSPYVWFHVRTYDKVGSEVPCFEPGIVRLFVKDENADIVTMPLVAISWRTPLFERYRPVHFTNCIRTIMDAAYKAGKIQMTCGVGELGTMPKWLIDYQEATQRVMRLWTMEPAADECTYITRVAKQFGLTTAEAYQRRHEGT